MQQVVKYIFIVVLCLAPVGCVAAGFYIQAARKAAKEGKLGIARYHRTYALGRVIVAFMDLAAGAVGYWLVTNYEFSWFGLSLLLWLIVPSGVVMIFFARHAAKIRRRYEVQHA